LAPYGDGRFLRGIATHYNLRGSGATAPERSAHERQERDLRHCSETWMLDPEARPLLDRRNENKLRLHGDRGKAWSIVVSGGSGGCNLQRVACVRMSRTLTERPPESTTSLLRDVRGGDMAARDRLIARCLPLLRRWAHGRLPPAQRDLSETADLVQTAVLRALAHLDTFQTSSPGALLAYLRQIVLNEIRDRARALAVRPKNVPIDADLADSAAGVVQHAIDAQTTEHYERALAGLEEHQRNAVVLRIEFGLSYAEMAVELELPSSDAARMLVARALVRLARLMP